MKKIFSCLIPVFLLASFIAFNIEKSDSSLEKSATKDSTTELSSSFSEELLDSDLFIHSNLSNSQTFRSQSSTKRTSTNYKNNLEFVKLGKRVNTALVYLAQKKSLTTHTSFIKPYHRLISLGKLII